jgi:dihydroxy-acid dehydratase
MYTANTMASAIEALGLSLPNSSAQEAVGEAKRRDCRRAGAAVMRLLEAGIRPADILTRKAFENAITVTIALSGSTNAVLHLLAIARGAGQAAIWTTSRASAAAYRCSPTCARAGAI